MQPAKPTLTVNGQPWTAYEKLTVHAAINEAARTFTLEIAAEGGAASAHAVFHTGAVVVVTEGADTAFTGYVDRRRPHIDRERAIIAVSGRAKGADAVDSSAVHPTGRFDQQTPLDIARQLTASTGLDVNWSADVDLDKTDHQIQPGATVFREVEILCRDQNATLAGDGDGSIRITNAVKAKRQAGPLIDGVNMKAMSADHNDSGKHSKVIVRGQAVDGHGPVSLQIEASATESTVARTRPHIVVLDRNTDKTKAGKHAKGKRDRKAGNSRRAEVETVGWRDEAGALFAPGNLQYTESAFLDIAQDKLIEGLDCEIDTEGSRTRLSLVDPRAHGGKTPAVSKSGAEWGQDSSEAS